jgi:CheY-like chemotaxis protein/HPt (histidine-containing phosphotransfer) domain-containing protein
MTQQKAQNPLPTASHILLVDDCDVNQFVAQQYLERAGFQVDIVQNGQQALDALKQRQYDLILMDIVMPVMDGYEAARRIRKAECGLRRAQSSRRRNKKREDPDLKSEVPGPDHTCECRGNKDQPEKHSCSQKDCKCSGAGVGQNPKSEIPGPDRICEGGVNKHPSIKHSGLVKNYQSNRARAGRNPKSEIEGVPIVGMSGHDPDNVMDKCWKAGMNGCIGKPLQQASLISMAKKWTAGDFDFPSNKNKGEELCRPHPKATEKQPPIDIERTVAEFMDKTELLLGILETFRIRVRAQIMQMKQHLSANNYNPIFSEAHSIKGGAGNLGAFKLSKAAAQLEEAAAEESPARAAAAVDDLEREFHILYQYLEQSEMGKVS